MPPPPSREPGQAGVTDAEAETWQGIYQDLYDGRQLAIQRLLAARTRYQERITELEKGLRRLGRTVYVDQEHPEEWHLNDCPAHPEYECPVDCPGTRALLKGVRDG